MFIYVACITSEVASIFKTNTKYCNDIRYGFDEFRVDTHLCKLRSSIPIVASILVSAESLACKLQSIYYKE